MARPGWVPKSMKSMKSDTFDSIDSIDSIDFGTPGRGSAIGQDLAHF